MNNRETEATNQTKGKDMNANIRTNVLNAVAARDIEDWDARVSAFIRTMTKDELAQAQLMATKKGLKVSRIGQRGGVRDKNSYYSEADWYGRFWDRLDAEERGVVDSNVVPIDWSKVDMSF